MLGLFLLPGLLFRSSFRSLDHGLNLSRIGHVDFTELSRAIIFRVGLRGRVVVRTNFLRIGNSVRACKPRSFQGQEKNFSKKRKKGDKEAEEHDLLREMRNKPDYSFFA